MTDRLHIHDWDEHQTYRKDRNQPPWIKLHRRALRNPKWVALTDAQQGQLVNLWMLAAEDDGWIVDNPAFLKKMCCLDSEPDLEVFVSLGFIDERRQGDVNVTSSRRRADAPEVEAETEAETDYGFSDEKPAEPSVENPDEERWNDRLAPFARELGDVGRWLAWAKDLGDPERAERIMDGLRSLRDRGAIDYCVKPGVDCTPGVLSVRNEGQPVSRRAEAEWHRIHRPKRSPAHPRDAQRFNVSVGGAA